LILLIILAPIGAYWYSQRLDTHARWDVLSNYSEEFFIDTSDVAYQMRGNFGPWGDNISRFYGGVEMADAQNALSGIRSIDQSHQSQLDGMITALYAFRSSSGAFCGKPSYCAGNITDTQRANFSTRLESLAFKVYNAYNNYRNYTSTSSGVGPPFWYSGPTPPDERDLQDAVTIAGNLTG
jgi:hypothetical protein